MIENVSFYCVNYKDETRKTNMVNRFTSFNIDLFFVDPVELDDLRLDKTPNKRGWSIMLQHLDSISHFLLNTTNNFCVVCEDDILLSINFVRDFPEIINTFTKLTLDVMVLGYLVPFKIEDWFSHFHLKDRTDKYSFYDFPSDLWGSQMYMISRTHAEHLINKYTIDYALEGTEQFSPDWTLTKIGAKAIIYPMIALEEGGSKSGFSGEEQFHFNCYQTNYIDGEYI